MIGRRRVDTHFLALRAAGRDASRPTQNYEFKATKLRGADVFLDEPSVTATENALTAAVLAEGQTILRNAASEPHVQDLANFLVALGAKIDGIGTNTLTIHGGRAARRRHAPHRPRSHRGRLADRPCRRHATRS